MVFFDTCIWIELLGIRSPKKQHEIKQAKAATSLLEQVIQSKEQIITCKEQILELLSAILKVKLKECSQILKSQQLPGMGNLKEFRNSTYFQDTKDLIYQVYQDIQHFTTLNEVSYEIEQIIQNLDLVDINDYIYFDYCRSENIQFYTFDNDFRAIGESSYVNFI